MTAPRDQPAHFTRIARRRSVWVAYHARERRRERWRAVYFRALAASPLVLVLVIGATLLHH